MASTINSTTSSGVVVTPDNTGNLALQSGGTTIMTVTSTGVTTQVGAPAFSAWAQGVQSLSASTFTKIACNTIEYDTNSNYNNTTYRFTPTVAGYYQFNVGIEPFSSSCRIINAIYKNGSVFKYLSDIPSSNYGGGSVVIYANGSTDYFEFYAYFSTAQNINNAQNATWFQATFVRSA